MLKPINALIAEDDPMLRRLFYKAFKHAGFECDIVDNGQLALKKIENNRPDVLILDLGLPGISGRDILTKIKNTPCLNHVNIIIVSGNQAADQIIDADRADLIMIKPVSPRDLVKLTERFANTRTQIYDA